MSTVGLFALGVVVTLIVGAGLSLLVLGAVLDGRDEAQRKAAEAPRVSALPALHIPGRRHRGGGRPGSAGRSQRSE